MAKTLLAMLNLAVEMQSLALLLIFSCYKVYNDGCADYRSYGV